MLPKLKMVDMSFELSSFSVEPFRGEPGNLTLNTPPHTACPGKLALVMRPDQRNSSRLQEGVVENLGVVSGPSTQIWFIDLVPTATEAGCTEYHVGSWSAIFSE